jgi:hypothetical protein
MPSGNEPAQTEAFALLARQLDELPASQIGSELNPFVDIQLRNRSLFRETVEREHAASPDDGSLPSVVASSVERAIKRVDDTETRSRLGQKAVTGLVGILEVCDSDFILPLAVQAGRLAMLIPNQEERAKSWFEIVRGTAQAADDTDRGPEMAETVMTYLDHVAEMASQIVDKEDGAAASRLMREVAAESAKQAVRLARKSEVEDALSAATIEAVRQQPLRLYAQTTEAASQIDGPNLSLRECGKVAVDMADSAVQTHDMLPELSHQLMALSTAEITSLTEMYATGVAATFQPTLKGHNLAKIGSGLAQIIAKDFTPPSDNPEQKTYLLGQVLQLFETAHDYVQGIRSSYIGSNHWVEEVSSMAFGTAIELFPVDPPAAEQLFRISFKAAETLDLITERVSRPLIIEETRSNLNQLCRLAKKQAAMEAKFRLYALAHEFNEAHEGDAAPSSHAAHDIFFGLLYDLGKTPDKTPEEEVRLEEINRHFIEATLKYAVTNMYSQYEGLRKLGQYVADPELQQAIAEQAGVAEAKYDKQYNRADSEIVRLAQEIKDNRND